MLLKRRKKRDADIRLSGWKKFFYYLGRVLLFPLRRPVITLLILLVLFLAPTFRGVKPVQVHKWYAEQISKAYNNVLVWWGIRQPEVTPGEFKFNPSEAAPAPITPTEFSVPEMTDEPAPNILDVLRGENDSEKKVEEQTKDTPKEKPVEEPEKIEEKTELKPVDEPVLKEGIRLPEDESLYAYPEDKKVYSLKYVDFPREIFGKAKVHNCNEIEVNDSFILLYGIYVHPYTVQGENATKYLKDLIENKDVKCGIVAYTDQDIPTGICYFGDENINRTMVLKGYTKNVAL